MAVPKSESESAKVRYLEYTAYVLAGFTAGGGTVGYIITGQVHSILVGCGFGLLCLSLSSTFGLASEASRFNDQIADLYQIQSAACKLERDQGKHRASRPVWRHQYCWGYQSSRVPFTCGGQRQYS